MHERVKVQRWRQQLGLGAQHAQSCQQRLECLGLETTKHTFCKELQALLPATVGHSPRLPLQRRSSTAPDAAIRCASPLLALPAPAGCESPLLALHWDQNRQRLLCVPSLSICEGRLLRQ